MSRKLSRFAFLGVLLLPALQAPLNAQDQQPSLGDVARQARKAKEEQAKSGSPKHVITDDILPQGNSASSATLANLDNPKVSATDRVAAARAQLTNVEHALDVLEPMDRGALAKLALEGRETAFPGRAAWEEKLFNAKQYYVAHGRDLLRETKQILDEAESFAASGKPASSEKQAQAQQLMHRVHLLMRDASQTEANFQAVIVEGQELANGAAASKPSSSN